MKRQKSLSVRTATIAVMILCLALTSLASAEVTQEGNLRVSLEGGVAPQALPRKGLAPVQVTLKGEISTVDGQAPPQLQTVSMAINRNGRLDYRGLPVCHYHQIQPATTNEAISTCPESVIGKGAFKANVVLPEQSPFPSAGKMIAFNGIFHGEHVVFAHVYGTNPLPQSNVLVFKLSQSSGTYRTTLTTELPRVAAEWGSVKALSLSLRRTYRYKGQERSYLSAGCPVPKGISGASFALAKASFGFADGRTLVSTLTRSCHAKG
jgi:hypothetical protein